MADDLSDEDAAFKEFCASIGFIVLMWGGAELSLDLVVGIIFKKYDGRRINRRIPRPIETKTKYLRRCFTELDELKRFKRDGLRVIDRFDKLAPKRHDLIHGAVDDTVSSTRVSYRFHKLDFHPQQHKHRSFRFSPTNFSAFASKLIRLDTMTNDLLRRIRKDAFGEGHERLLAQLRRPK